MPHVIVLGCGGSAGVPHLGGSNGRGDWGACDAADPRNRRTRSSIVIEDGTDSKRRRLLVDTGPDMREQLLACAIGRVDAICLTHAHADHIVGLDDVRILNRVVDRPLETFATARTLREVAVRFDYAFRPWQPPGFFRPVLITREIEAGQPFEAAGMRVETFVQNHGFMPSLGLRVGSFGYSTDAVALDDAAFAALRGVDTWLVGCFQRAPHRTHANVEQVVAWAARVGARRTVLTHMGYDLDYEWLRRHLPGNIEPGYDGMILDCP